MSSAFTTPLVIDTAGRATALNRIPLSGPESSSAYSEAWLQELLYRHPSALPIAEIDESFTGLIPVCREMQTPAGPVDVVYVTPNGRPVIVEAKLWRNPEARRKVVGQVLDYAKELGRFDYDRLDAAIKSARRTMDREDPPKGLATLVREKVQVFDEAQFCDSVARNLRRGDFLLLIVGDGIREGVGAIADFLESHGTLHFTFGLVEMAIYRTPDGGQLVQPRVLAQSAIIRRIVVDLRSDAVEVSEEAPEAADADVGGASPEVIASRERFQTFWAAFLDRLQLDDRAQPVRPPAKSQNQYFPMPKGSDAWVSAYVAPSVHRAGVYLTFSKGPIGDRLYSALRDSQAEIEQALGVPVEWESDGQKHWIVAARSYMGDLIEDHAPELIEVMTDRVNRFVNVFRPRLEALVSESQ